MSRIFVLGSGAWGTAIALALHRRGGHEVTLWAHSPEAAAEILDAGENVQFLPGFPIPCEITITGDCAAVSDAQMVVSVVPSGFLRCMACASTASHGAICRSLGRSGIRIFTALAAASSPARRSS